MDEEESKHVDGLRMTLRSRNM